jgi:Right handed beta helix region
MGRDDTARGAITMKWRALCFTLSSTIAISIAASLPAQAQRSRVFVSINGVDSGQCQATAPCRTFAFAESAVLAGGEISVLNTGGYGQLTITKALSIVAPAGVEAAIAIPSGGTGITINAGSADIVSLRGLTLDGQGVGAVGIAFNSGLTLTVIDCVIRNVTGAGLVFSSAATTAQFLAVSNSYFNDDGDDGIFIETESSGAISASIDRTGFYGNSNIGLQVEGAFGTGILSVAVTDSVASNNGVGFYVESATGKSVSNLALTHCLATGNFIGVDATGTNATLWLAQSTVTGSGLYGFKVVNGGTVESYGDNYLAAGNAGNTGSLTPAGKQ